MTQFETAEETTNVIAVFGEARLVKRTNGGLELRGGSPSDLADAKGMDIAFHAGSSGRRAGGELAVNNQ